MIWFIAKRLVWLVLILWAVFTVTFLLMAASPAGPLSRERQMPPEIERNIARRFNLDLPLSQQYLLELRNVLRGDLGYSYKLSDYKVNEIIREGFPISASLGILALCFALTLGLTAGIISAVRRQTVLDFGLMSAATVGIAVPDFIVAALSILLFCFIWPLFPAAGWGSVSQLILPALCLGAPYAAYIARLSRTGMLDVLSQDYIRTAYAKGLPPRTVILRHALKGALLPVVSFLGPAIAGIMTGSLVIETIFAIPGLGLHFVQAATQNDDTVSMGIALVDTALVYTMNLLVDISYQYFDPRVKLE